MELQITTQLCSHNFHCPLSNSIVKTMPSVDHDLLQKQVDLLHSMSVSDPFVEGDSILWGLIEFLNDLVDMGKIPVDQCTCKTT